MAKGITQDQVNAAADVLVTVGERPTVEKIRARLGTGSPNTVTRMLDTWRGALAMRLSQVLALPDVPADVGQALTEVWRLAMAQAALVQEQNALLAAQSSLAQERKIWEIAIAEARAQAQSADQAREVAETRLADIQRLVEQQAGQPKAAWRPSVTPKRCISEPPKIGRTPKSIELGKKPKLCRRRCARKERETSTIASRLEAAVASVRAAEHLATEHGARAKTLEQQLARMDGVPAALLAAQQSLQAALQRETMLQAKLDHLVASTKIQPAVRKRKSRKASGFAEKR